MKKIKVNIIYLVGLLVLISSIGVVLAAFMFNQVVNVDTQVGGIEIESKAYLDYALYNNVSNDDANKLRKERLRKDTVAILDDIIFTYSSEYKLTQDSKFIDGKVYYYIDNGTYKVATSENNSDYVIDGNIVSNKYYEETRTFNGIDRVVTLYNSSCVDLVPTINANVITFTNSDVLITVTCVINSTLGIVESAEAEATDKDYRCVIDGDGRGLSILDNKITESASGYTEVSASSRITCSATQSKYDDPDKATDDNKHYLSQYGLKFTFKTEIPVYVRVHIQDAWSSIKVFSSNTKKRYVTKDKVAGKTPFNITGNEWYYDEDTNYVYLKNLYNPNDDLDSDGNIKSKTYTFTVNEAYFYQLNSGVTAYSEYVDVELSFTVDIIQANRAKAMWGLDPSVEFA